MSKELVEIPYHLTKEVKKLGAVYNPQKDAYEVDTDSPNYEAIKELNKTRGFNGNLPEHRQSAVMDKVRNIQEDAMLHKAEIKPVVFKSFDWSSLLGDDWDVLKFLDLIRTYGMPENKAHRINMLKNLAGKYEDQLHVPYSNLSEYSSAFEETYSWEVIRAILFQGRINSGNFFVSVHEAEREGRIDEEQACLLRYVFPIAVSKDYVMTREYFDECPPINKPVEFNMEM